MAEPKMIIEAKQEITKAEIIKIIIQVILVPIVMYGVKSVDKLNDNVSQLNLKVGVLVDKTERYDKQFEKLEEADEKLSNRVLILEQKGK